MTLENVHVIRPTADTIEYYTDILKEINTDNASLTEIKVFEFEFVRYIFNHRIEQFVRMRQFDEISTTNQLMHSSVNYVSDTQRDVL